LAIAGPFKTAQRLLIGFNLHALKHDDVRSGLGQIAIENDNEYQKD
jgi:hypothetical protein